MNIILFPFIVLSAIGLFLSLIVHICSLFDIIFFGDELILILFIGLFLVWIPAILVSEQLTRNVPKRQSWDVALLGCPRWMKRMVNFFFFYIVVNFAIFMLTRANHSTSVNSISPEDLQVFSSFFMAFYSFALATLYSATQRQDLMKDIKCSNGHTVSPTDRFCPKCGAFIPTRTHLSKRRRNY